MKPLLIIVSGFPATGKTKLAEKISECFKLPVICADKLKEIIFDQVGNWEDREFLDSVGKATYDLLYHMADQFLYAGNSCVLEAFFLSHLADARIAKLKKQYGCDILQIHLYAKEEVLIERYCKRHGSIDRHPCHPEHSPENEFTKKGETKINVDGETISVDTTDFDKVDWEIVFNKIREYIGREFYS